MIGLCDPPLWFAAQAAQLGVPQSSLPTTVDRHWGLPFCDLLSAAISLSRVVTERRLAANRQAFLINSPIKVSTLCLWHFQIIIMN